MARSVPPGDPLGDRLVDLVRRQLDPGTGWLASGVELPGVAPWSRTAHGGRAAAAFPPDGPWRGAVIRWPRARDAGRMVAELLGARLAPDGVFAAVAPNAEGGKSVAGSLADLFGSLEEHYGGKGRLVVARGPAPALRADPDAHRVDVDTPVGRLASWPGLFAHGRLDAGTELLLEHLPPARGARVLDFGCGAGVLGRALSDAAHLDLCDVDALAVHAARINVPGAAVHLADGVPAGLGPWDLAVSNPPLHTGSAVDPELLRALARDLRLAPGGELRLVTLHTVPVPAAFAPRAAERVAERPPFVVWRIT